MPEYTEVYLVYSGRESSYSLERYRQPRWAHWRGQLYHVLWERPTWRIRRRLDRWERRRHRRTCQDGCGVGSGPEGQEVRMCTHMPGGMRVELRCYDLKHVGWETISREDVSEELAILHGWPRKYTGSQYTGPFGLDLPEAPDITDSI